MIKKKKIIFLENDIGFEIKIGLNLAKTKTKLIHMRYRVPWKVPLDLLKIWQKGYDFQFAGSTNKFSSRPLMRPILQDNWGFFTNIAAFWLFLRFQTVFRFSDGVFFPPEGKKKPRKKTDHIIPSLFYGSIAKIIGILTEIKRPYPFGIAQGYST